MRKVKRKHQPGKQAPSDFFFEKENLLQKFGVSKHCYRYLCISVYRYQKF